MKPPVWWCPHEERWGTQSEMIALYLGHGKTCGENAKCSCKRVVAESKDACGVCDGSDR